MGCNSCVSLEPNPPCVSDAVCSSNRRIIRKVAFYFQSKLRPWSTPCNWRLDPGDHTTFLSVLSFSVRPYNPSRDDCLSLAKFLRAAGALGTQVSDGASPFRVPHSTGCVLALYIDVNLLTYSIEFTAVLTYATLQISKLSAPGFGY